MMEQLILHLIGDYLTQSHWMAQNKTKRSLPAWIHAVVYTIPFVLLCPSGVALATILITHFLIDRFRLARFVVWAKNKIGDPGHYGYTHPSWYDETEWRNCNATGYPNDTPAWLAVWLLIIADNTLHLICNYAALRWL